MEVIKDGVTSIEASQTSYNIIFGIFVFSMIMAAIFSYWTYLLAKNKNSSLSLWRSNKEKKTDKKTNEEAKEIIEFTLPDFKFVNFNNNFKLINFSKIKYNQNININYLNYKRLK